MKESFMLFLGRSSRQLKVISLVSFITTMMLLCPTRISAQGKGKFFFVAEGRSSNLWSMLIGGYSAWQINKLVSGTDDVGYHYQSISDNGTLHTFNANMSPGLGITFKRWNEAKNFGEKIDVNNFKYFGFKAVDLFRDFEYSLKFGWQPQQIPVGFYAKIGYKHENFNSRIDENSNWTKHRINTFRPGLGIKVSPLENLLGNKAFCPVFEIGSTYNYHFNYKGGMNSDVKELNNGISAHIAVGAKMRNGNAFFLRFEKDTYDLFNKDYTVNGVKPYEGYTTNRCNLTLSVDVGL